MNTNLIATASTSNGFAIGIVRIARSGAFSVVRMNRRSQYVTISTHGTEASARTAANREWALDRAAA